jgi:hypothetical protein
MREIADVKRQRRPWAAAAARGEKIEKALVRILAAKQTSAGGENRPEVSFASMCACVSG